MKHLQFIYLFAAAILLTNCYPGGPENTDDYDLVASNYAEEYDFDKNLTYFMPDSVIHVVDSTTKEEDIDRSQDETILARVALNMDMMGYELAANDSTANVIVLPQVLRIQNVDVSWWYDWSYWWGWYPWGGWWGPGYGWYYPGGYPVVTSYETGTIILQMVDPDEPTPLPDDIYVAWSGYANGVLSSSKNYNKSRIETTIDDMFEISPYLELNN